MAQGKIVVDTSRLDAAANKVDQLADSYESEYGALYNSVQELQSAYSGEDNVAFTNQIEGFRDDFARMTKLMREYSQFLRKTANTYRETRAAIAGKAKTLPTGN